MMLGDCRQPTHAAPGNHSDSTAVRLGNDEASEARRRLAAQTDEATRVRHAHRVLRNEGSLAELRRQVDALIADIREEASGGS